MNPLVVPRVIPAPENFKQFSKTVGRVFIDSFLQSRDDLVITSCIGLISIHGYAYASKTTGSTLTKIETLHHEVNELSAHCWL